MSSKKKRQSNAGDALKDLLNTQLVDAKVDAKVTPTDAPKPAKTEKPAPPPPTETKAVDALDPAKNQVVEAQVPGAQSTGLRPKAESDIHKKTKDGKVMAISEVGLLKTRAKLEGKKVETVKLQGRFDNAEIGDLHLERAYDLLRDMGRVSDQHMRVHLGIPFSLYRKEFLPRLIEDKRFFYDTASELCFLSPGVDEDIPMQELEEEEESSEGDEEIPSVQEIIKPPQQKKIMVVPPKTQKPAAAKKKKSTAAMTEDTEVIVKPALLNAQTPQKRSLPTTPQSEPPSKRNKKVETLEEASQIVYGDAMEAARWLRSKKVRDHKRAKSLSAEYDRLADLQGATVSDYQNWLALVKESYPKAEIWGNK